MRSVTWGTGAKRLGGRMARGGAVGLLALAACTNAGDAEPTDDPNRTHTAAKDAMVTVASESELTSYNNNTADQNTTASTFFLNQVLRGFWSFGRDGSIVPDTEFGTFEKTSDDPLTVDYTFDDEAVWSDGKPIDCDDFLLAWAANSGRYPAFSTAGTTGMELMRKPTCADGDRDVHVAYDQPYADWMGLFGQGVFVPAHVLETRSGVPDLVDAVAADDVEMLRRAAQFYNTGWELEPGVVDPELLPAAGPYRISGWQAGQSVTLTANDRWWGAPPKVRTVIVRIIAGDAQALALQNGEVDVISPQPQPDMLSRLLDLGDPVVVETGDRFAYEHLDFNFAGPFGDRQLREAFARCVPRQLIVDNLVTSINPRSQVLDSRFVMPFQAGYDDLASAVTDGRYDTVDIAGARAILQAEGKLGLAVRVGYGTPNQRRADTVSLIRDSCDRAGFDVRDVGEPDFLGDPVNSGNFDLVLFGWNGSPLVTAGMSTFSTGGGNNKGRYSNPDVDTLFRTLASTPDLDAQRRRLTEVDTLLWRDLATIPLYAVPGFVARTSAVSGVSFQPTPAGVTWNMHEWQRKS